MWPVNCGILILVVALWFYMAIITQNLQDCISVSLRGSYIVITYKAVAVLFWVGPIQWNTSVQIQDFMGIIKKYKSKLQLNDLIVDSSEPTELRIHGQNTLTEYQDRGQNSSVGSAWAPCPQRRGFDPPLGTFSVEGIFPLELTWVQTPFPQKLFRMRV